MDFTLNEEQEALRDAVGGMLSKNYGAIEARRRVTASDPGFDEKLWRQLAELGVLGLPFTEEDGGLGAGPVEVAVVAEQFGAVLAPEPFVEVVVLAGGLVADAGTAEQREELIGGIAAGEAVVAFAHHEPGGRWSPSARGVVATSRDGAWTLSGTKEPVVQGARADVLIVSAATGQGTGLFVVAGDARGLTRTGYRTHDGGRAARLDLVDVPAVPLGDPGTDRTATIARAQDRARTAYAHEVLGILQFQLSTTVDYLRTRKQFGVTLNTFQALKHRAADLYVQLELARSTTWWASILLDEAQRGDEGLDVAAAAAHASLRTSKAARLIGAEAIQLHGGIGVTAEYSVGHYSSRLIAIERLAGDGSHHLAHVAAGLRGHGTLDPTE
ncbi:acyl-CoA dehydrogenase family protein [Kineococcus sp. SYSU DK001]|uniref:acyl-CoA dehydrogenase family protein n=1 Tax=Kineococcus sp. SYSU DK001 TaxID=3383122 RepID=UPI003D7D1910